jgi:hypothetical protein
MTSRILAAALLALAAQAQALTNADLLGLWRLQDHEGPGSVMEIWYAEDGRRELRTFATYEGIGEHKLHLLGTWNVSGDKVVETTDGGWISFDGEVSEIVPEKTSTSSAVELVAGEPRKIKITDCDGQLCVTREFTHVSAAKDFSLEDLGATTAVRRARRAAVRLRGSGRLGPLVHFGGRAFDLRGRHIPLRR